MTQTEQALSAHALQRAAEMGIESQAVLDALADPEITYRADPERYPGCRVAVRGEIAVPFAEDSGLAITVLWHRAEGR